ncbi:MAG: peptidylprolyl isomerase [Planctomycetes bacterium]|nr:peptidylprolyl isomerase [Planctomycetota bacterium]
MAFPALAVGTYTITGHYGRNRDWSEVPGFAAEPPPPLAPVSAQADPVKVTVTPDAEGNDALAVRIVTTHGPMRAELFTDGPTLGTALHFADLIQYGAYKQGVFSPNFYDGLIFHRAMPGFMIQGGDPKRDGSGGPGYMIPAEIPDPLPEGLTHTQGTLSMARSGHPDSAGSQFYVTVADRKDLDGRYTAFGRLTHGLDVAVTISQVERVEQGPKNEKSRPVEPVVMDSVRLVPFKK